MYFVDGMNLAAIFKDVFPYYTEGFRLKKLNRSDLEGYDALKESLSTPLDYNMSYGRLVNNAGEELGMFQTVNNRTKVLFNSEFIFSQINNADKTVNNYYLTFAFYLNNDFTFKSFSFDFLYSFKPYNGSGNNRYSNHIELILDDDFVKITTDGVDYDLNGTQTIFEILPDFVLACIYNANNDIVKDDHFDLNLILQGQKIDDKKRCKDLLSMISY
jgi:hypothetical protein